ncbi:MAG: sigma-70 family RNA polymerase sigma factor [Eubacterium sp.]|nr:sigma-70 family RNA polymerase sigma factor [Eubacterium sp.]
MQNENTKTDEELIEAAKAHDESAVDELMNRYKGLVRKHARALFLIGGDGDDLIQEGMIALYKSVISYGSSDRTGSFSSYASTCISNHLYNVIKGANRLKNAPLNQSISLDAPVADMAEGGIKTVADTLPPDNLSDPAQILIDRENVTQIEDWIEARLSPLEKRVVRLYIEGNSVQAIAKTLERSPKSVDNALQRVKKKLTFTNSNSDAD